MSACRRFDGFKVPIGNGCLLFYRILLLMATIGGYVQSKQQVERHYVDGDGIVNFVLDLKIRKMFICYPVKASSNGSAKFGSRFRTENNKSSEIAMQCQNYTSTDANENNGTVNSDWYGFMLNWDYNHRVEIENAYGTKCISGYRPIFYSIHIDLKNGIMYGDSDPSKIVVCNGDKKKDFENDQINGAFLLDYIDMWWFFCNDINFNNGTYFLTQNMQTMSTSTTTITTSTITYKILEMDQQKCTAYMEKVKPAYINDEHPEYVIRFGYVYQNSSSTTKLKPTNAFIEKFNQSFDVKEWFAKLNLTMDDVLKFLKDYNDFFYTKIPTHIVGNDEGTVLMNFVNCDGIIFAGLLVDFDHLKKCEQKQHMRIDDEKNQFAMPWNSNGMPYISIEADVALPVQIGILLQSAEIDQLTSAQIQAHRYFYGHRNFPKCSIRPHLVEELNDYARSKKYGRYITGYEEFYKLAKPHTLSAEFKELSLMDLREFYPISDEDYDNNNYSVTPKLNQQYYRCDNDKYRIYTSRFDASQLTTIIWEGQSLNLRFTNLSKEIKLDDDVYKWNNDPSKIFLEKRP